jgi:hypothetical protein
MRPLCLRPTDDIPDPLSHVQVMMMMMMMMMVLLSMMMMMMMRMTMLWTGLKNHSPVPPLLQDPLSRKPGGHKWGAGRAL